ncbi:MAG: sialidase family protein, partial [Terriglobia bacterium]
GHGATRNGIYVRRSLDGGRTWDASDIPVVQHATAPGIPFDDKPYIVADNTSGPYAGNLYVGWTRWELDDSRLLFSRSTDDGNTWSQPVELDSHPGLPRDDNGGLEGFDGAAGPDGTLYVVWTDGSRITFTESKDGGRTFAPPRAIIHTAPAFFTVDGVSRSNGFPQIATDSRGKLYVTWSDYRNGEVDVFCSTSQDHGRSWTPAVKVNSDPIHDGTDHFFQWLAVDPVTGAANVIFYDRRGDPNNQRQIIVLARSTDGGETFANYAWMTKPFDADGLFIGDYTGLAAFDGRVYGAWTVKLPGTPVPQGENKGSSELPRSKHRAYWRSHGTVIQVGVADFTSQESRQGTASTVP